MLKIRLQRVGRKHDPSYRIVLTEARQGPKSGNFIENLGFYDARANIKQVKGERVNYWIGNGAQVSDTVHNILVSEKVIKGNKINALPKKTPIVKEVTEEPSSAEVTEDKEVEEVTPEKTEDDPVKEADPEPTEDKPEKLEEK
ncbi:MAG: 30S ribosomal protein S16 [Patescibacteria group bacterium]|nr:30S ribosomal protein S16 [Patescibacteria group bacterium]